MSPNCGVCVPTLSSTTLDLAGPRRVNIAAWRAEREVSMGLSAERKRITAHEA
jgi:hypothetical protein